MAIISLFLWLDVCQFCKGQGPTGARLGDAVFCKVLEAWARQRFLVACKTFIILYYIKYGITNASSRKRSWTFFFFLIGLTIFYYQKHWILRWFLWDSQWLIRKQSLNAQSKNNEKWPAIVTIRYPHLNFAGIPLIRWFILQQCSCGSHCPFTLMIYLGNPQWIWQLWKFSCGS